MLSAYSGRRSVAFDAKHKENSGPSAYSDRLVEVGYNVDPEGNNFWEVEVFEDGGQEYVAASDRDAGLWIFRYTGD